MLLRPRGAIVALVLAVAVLASCASFRPLPSGSNFVLAPDEGLLVVHTATDTPVVYVAVDGEPVVKHLMSGVRYQIVVARAGSYRWSDVVLVEKKLAKDRWRGHIRTREIRDYWRFEVVPGAINYPGQMVIYTNGGLRQGISDVRLVNRSGQIWLILRKRYPELVARYPVVHTGGVRDAFFERLTRREPPVRESDE